MFTPTHPLARNWCKKTSGPFRIMMNPYQQHGKATDAVHFGQIKAFLSAELVRAATGLICCREKQATQLWEVQGQRQTWHDCEIRPTILFQVIPQEQLHDVLRSGAFYVSQIALPYCGAIRVLHDFVTREVIHIGMRIGPLLGDCS